MKVKLVTRMFILSISLFTFSEPVHAVEKKIEEMTLEDLLNMEIESATKTGISQIEVPQSISTLTKSDISKINANNLGELLRNIVGSNVVKIQSSQNVLGTRGSNAFSPSKILILIDGQPIDPTLFSTTWWELVPISVNDIEKIEFIRSPGTIYGANAENGVVNIITQKVGFEQEDTDKLSAQLKYGQQNLMLGYLSYMGKKVILHISYLVKLLI